MNITRPLEYEFGPKDDPESWKQAYRTFIEGVSLEELQGAKERYEKFTGKKYIKS